MARRACIIGHMLNLNFPVGLPQLIADYAPWTDSERLAALFRCNGGKYITVSSLMEDAGYSGFLEIKCVDDSIIEISCSVDACSCRHYWRHDSVITYIINGRFDSLLQFYRLTPKDMRTCEHLIGQVYEMWREV